MPSALNAFLHLWLQQTLYYFHQCISHPESKTTRREMPSPGSGNPDSPLLFILLLLLLRDQWSRCNTYYRGFQDPRISRRWLEINLHNPPRSFPSLSPLFLLVNLGKAAERVHPQRGIMGIPERGHDRRGREAVAPVVARRAVRSLQRSHSKGSVVTCSMWARGL